MKIKKITLISVISLALFCSCLNEAHNKVETTNSNFEVEFLFEKDGCKIYRFIDGGHAVYWTDCRGKVEDVHNESSGKSSHEVRTQNETVTEAN